MMNLDTVAGALTGWLAVCLFSLHIVSSPARRSWMTIPEYVRRGFLVTGVMFAWRSANFFSVASSSVALGRINAEGMMALIAVTYTISAVAWWVCRSHLPKHGWQKIQWLQQLLQRQPEMVPVVVPSPQTSAEAVEIARAQGAGVSIGPGEGPEAVEREMARVHKDELR